MLDLQHLGLGVEQLIVLQGVVRARRIGEGCERPDAPIKSGLEVSAPLLRLTRDDERHKPPIRLAHDVELSFHRIHTSAPAKARMKSRAVDFLTKPIQDLDPLEAGTAAIRMPQDRRQYLAQIARL